MRCRLNKICRRVCSEYAVLYVMYSFISETVYGDMYTIHIKVLLFLVFKSIVLIPGAVSITCVSYRFVSSVFAS